MKQTIILVLGFSISCWALPSQKESEPFKIERKLNKQRRLEINFPCDFKIGSYYEGEKGPILELVPEGENVENWSELIVLSVVPTQIDPYLTVLELQKLYAGYTTMKPTKNKIDFFIDKGVKIGSSVVEKWTNIGLVEETSPLGFHEITSVRVFDGDNSSVSLVYRYKYDPEKLTGNEKQEMYKKIDAFWSECKILISDASNKGGK